MIDFFGICLYNIICDILKLWGVWVMSGYFSGLFGNEATKKRLGTAITSGTLSHAFLLSGPDGSGKAVLATEIAAALNCERGGNVPCHSCNSCRRIAANEFTDVKTLRKPSDKATIGIGEVRAFRDDMFLSATESKYKIYIVDDAEKMTPNAQNALLKVIEEPPANVIILLLTSSDDAILTTIKSRTQYVAMQRFDEAELERYIKEKGIQVSSSGSSPLRELLMCADGRIGKALELISGGERDVQAIRAATDALIAASKDGVPYSELYSAAHLLPTKKDELTEALESVQTALRDLVLLKHDENAPLLYYPTREVAQEISKSIGTRRLMKIYDVVTDSLCSLSKNVSSAAIITNLGARIKLI